MATFSINLKDGSVESPKPLIVGIDLGTTNSLVAFIKDGQPFCVKGADGRSTLVPSILHFTQNGDILVGEAAKEKLITDPANTIFSVKRLMGKSFKDIQANRDYFGYQIIDDDTDSLVKIRVQDRFYSPIELSALILKELKVRVEAELGQSIEKAVITVPAYFNDNQRQATRDAGKLAGLDVLRIVNEPTAAALAAPPSIEGAVAVYDLGGGTFDISILQIQDGLYEVLATNGDTFLGGDDFDRVIVEHFLEQLGCTREDLTTDPNFGQTLRLLAEQAKKELSQFDLFESKLPESLSQSFETGSSFSNKSLQITRITFEALIEPLITRTLDCCRNVLRDAKLSPDQIGQVVMVGGSTRIPLVKNRKPAF